MSPKVKFEVIPLNEVPMDSSTPDTKQPEPVVLIVDDERIIADTLSIILGKSGYRVMTA
jgi:hypothetical protein